MLYYFARVYYKVFEKKYMIYLEARAYIYKVFEKIVHVVNMLYA